MKYYSYVSHNPQALTTDELFISFPITNRKTIYRLPYKKRFNKPETRNYIFEEFIRQVLLDIIENNTIFVWNKSDTIIASIQKEDIIGEDFERIYKKGYLKLDYLKSNFTGHLLTIQYEKISNRKILKKYIYLSGDLKTKKDKSSEIW